MERRTGLNKPPAYMKRRRRRLLEVISPFVSKIPSIGIFPTLALQSPATTM